jgi:protein-disulfide isomerase
MKLLRTSRRASALPALAVLLAGLAVPACARSADDAAAAEKPAASAQAVAEVGGQTIGYADLEGLLEAQSRRQYRQFLEAVVDEAIARKVLELEANARGISVDELLRTEVEAKTTPVTTEEVDAFYAQNQARIQGTLDQVRPQIEQYLRQQRQVGLRDQLLSTLRLRYGARSLLPVERMDVAEAGSPARGPAGAPITIIEFSDFECPFCNRVLPTLEQAITTYGDQIRLVFRQFPLNIHPHAQKAAEASLCADEQGKFWQLHDAMFADQKNLGVDQLKAKAAELGLDSAAFDACLDSGKFAARIAADMADGQAAGVNGTPALFVNGRFLSGAVPFESLAKVIDDELQRKGVAPEKKAAAE